MSYSKCPQTVAEFVQAIEGEGLSCWFAPRDLPPGVSWPAKIVEAISDAAAFVVLHSADVNDSVHCIRELTLATSREIPLWIVRLDAATLSAHYEYFFSNIQHEHYSSLDVKGFVESVRRGAIHPVQSLPVRSSGGPLPREEIAEVLDDAEAARLDGETGLADQLFETAVAHSEHATDDVSVDAHIGAAFAALQRGETSEAAAMLAGLGHLDRSGAALAAGGVGIAPGEQSADHGAGVSARYLLDVLAAVESSASDRARGAARIRLLLRAGVTSL